MAHRTDFDFTMMSTFLTCRRKYDFRINRGLVGKQRILALEFGGAIHKALDAWYPDRSLERALEAFKEAYKEDLEVDNKRTMVMGEWILKNYHQQYRDQPWILVASEKVFDIELPNGNRFIGRMDKVIDWSGVKWVVDHKTSSQLGPRFFDMANPNMQFTGYVWAAQMSGYPVKGFILDAILVAKGLLPGKSKSRSLTPLARFDEYRSEEQLGEWLRIVLMIQKDIKQCDERGEWYPNFDACTYYGECPFRKVCKEDLDIRERVIKSDYRVDHWDPRY